MLHVRNIYLHLVDFYGKGKENMPYIHPIIIYIYILVGGFLPTPFEKNMLVKMGSSSPGGESKKSLKPPVMTQV